MRLAGAFDLRSAKLATQEDGSGPIIITTLLLLAFVGDITAAMPAFDWGARYLLSAGVKFASIWRMNSRYRPSRTASRPSTLPDAEKADLCKIFSAPSPTTVPHGYLQRSRKLLTPYTQAGWVINGISNRKPLTSIISQYSALPDLQGPRVMTIQPGRIISPG